MTAHLPECLHSRPCERAVRGTGDRHVVNGGRCDNCDDPCTCPALRACTVRVQLQSERVGFKAGVRRTKSVVIDEMYRWGIAPSDDAAASILAAIDRLAQGAP